MMRNLSLLMPLLISIAYNIGTKPDSEAKSTEKYGLETNSTLTDIDGNKYRTVTLGGRIWMAENLKTTRYRNGRAIEFPGENDSAWEFDTTGAYAWYNNSMDNKQSYGALYNWYAVNNSNGLCPEGWHVPSDDEWTELLNYLIDSNPGISMENAGNALKSCRQVLSPLSSTCATTEHPRWNAHVTHFGTDEFGFSALPGGYRYYNGAYSSRGFNSYWWSSSPQSDKKSWSRDMGLNYSSVYHYEGNNQRGYSVRCVRDK